MLIASAAQKMLACSGGALHDIDHFLKVWSLARTIGELEGLDRHTQTVLEGVDTTRFFVPKTGTKL